MTGSGAGMLSRPRPPGGAHMVASVGRGGGLPGDRDGLGTGGREEK